MGAGETRGGRAAAPNARSRPAVGRWFLHLFLTLRGRLILLVSFATVPSIVFIFFAASQEREAVLDRMETEARHLGSLASREHSHQLNGARSLLRRLGDTLRCGEPGGADSGTCPAHLPTLLASLPQFANIGLADARGEVVCSAAPIEAHASLRRHTAFLEAMSSDDVVAGSYVLGFVGRPVLHLAHAVRDDAGTPCAVAFVAVELGWLDDLAAQANLPPDYSLLITDRTGHVLARSGADVGVLAAEQGRPVGALARALERPRGAVLEIGSPKTARYFVGAPMEGVPGVFVVAGLPYERVERTASRAFYRTLAGLVLVTIFAIASAILATELSVLRVLRSLTRAVRRFGSGDLTARAPLPGTHGELRELALSFHAMADALAARQREAQEARDRLRALSHRLQSARDEEAGRIARELHDELGQILTGLKMELRGWRRAANGSDERAGGDENVERMRAQIDRAIDSVRRISTELRPPVLDRLGLGAAIDWLVREGETKSGLTILLHVQDLQEPIDGRVSTALFRIVQEALTNVFRHAEASEVRVDLVGKPQTVELRVQDDGVGLDPARAEGPRSLGILGMRERVHLLGGTIVIRGEPGGGTVIEVSVPRAPGPAEEEAARERP